MKEFALAEVGAAFTLLILKRISTMAQRCANISESLYSKSGKDPKSAKSDRSSKSAKSGRSSKSGRTSKSAKSDRSAKNEKDPKSAKSYKNVKSAKSAAGTKFALLRWHGNCFAFYALGSGIFFAYIKCK